MKNNYKKKFKFLEIIKKYSLSSIICFMIDYCLFISTSCIIEIIIICNMIARVNSACCNYYLNRNYVFKSKAGLYKSSTQYIVLAVIILFFNSLLLHFLVNNYSLNKYFSKIIVEILLFFFSFFVQKKIIFKKIL